MYRILTEKWKHIQPNNLEKQNVQRAIDIFSPEMISAFRSYHEQGVPGFKNVIETVTFMEHAEKWNNLQGTESGYKVGTLISQQPGSRNKTVILNLKKFTTSFQQ